MNDSKIVKCYKITHNDYNESFYPSALEDLILTYITLYCNKIKEVTPNNAFWVNTQFLREDLINYVYGKTNKRLNARRISDLLLRLKNKGFLMSIKKSVYVNNGSKFYILNS